MAIPDAKIDEVRATADIVDVVSDYVRLKRSGSRYKGLCPFHNEKTPSFSVDPDQNLYYCFGCSNGGDLFAFLQNIEGVGFLESVRMLADRYGIALPENGRDEEAATAREAVYNALRFAGRFFYRQLTDTEAGQPALAYLTGRGFTEKTIRRFGLGYAPDRWDALLDAADAAQVKPALLEDAGLVIPRKGGDGYYDRYRGRVLFPLFSHVGKVLGFAGRILDADADQPKYINSPETEVYHKSEVLYGLHQAKKAIRREDEVLVVEGYTDVISLHQAGVEHAVATCGTALTAEQVQLLGRYAKRVVMVYDADEAGGRAAVRGLDLVLGAGYGAYVVELPAGDDPDAFVQREDAEAFAAYLDRHRMDMPTFRYRRAERAGDLATPEGEAATMHAVVEGIARIPDPLMQETYLRRASEVLGVPDIRLHQVLEQANEDLRRQEQRRARREAQRRTRQRPSGAPERGAPARPEAPPFDPDDEPDADHAGNPSSADPSSADSSGADASGADLPPDAGDRAAFEPPVPQGPLPEERVLLRLMLEHGAPLVEFILGNMALDEFTAGPPRTLVETLADMYAEDDMRPVRVLEGAHGPALQNLAASVMVDEHTPSENWTRKQNIPVPRFNQEPYEAGASAMTLLKLDRVKEAIDAQRQRIHQAADDDAAVRALSEGLTRLFELRKRIERREFLTWHEAG